MRNQHIHSQYIDLPQTAGLMSLQLPTNISLEANKSYRWKLALICDAINRGGDEYIWGTIQQTALATEQQQALKSTADPMAKAKLYAEFYAWNETLTNMAQLRESHPQEWQELLRSVGIETEAAIYQYTHSMLAVALIKFCLILTAEFLLK